MTHAISSQIPVSQGAPLDADMMEAETTYGGKTVAELLAFVNEGNWVQLRAALSTENKKTRARPQESALLLACMTDGLGEVVKAILDLPYAPSVEKLSYTHKMKANSSECVGALYYAVDRETTKILLDRGCADTNFKGKNCLETAYTLNHSEAVDVILENYPNIDMSTRILYTQNHQLASLSNASIRNLLKRFFCESKEGISVRQEKILDVLTREQQKYLLKNLPSTYHGVFQYLLCTMSDENTFWETEIFPECCTKESFQSATFTHYLLCHITRETLSYEHFSWICNTITPTHLKSISKNDAHCFNYDSFITNEKLQVMLADLLSLDIIPKEIFLQHLGSEWKNQKFPNVQLRIELQTPIRYSPNDFSDLSQEAQMKAKYYFLYKHADKLTRKEEADMLIAVILSHLKHEHVIELVAFRASKLPDPSPERDRVLFYAATNPIYHSKIEWFAGNTHHDLFLGERSTVALLLTANKHNLLAKFSDEALQIYKTKKYKPDYLLANTLSERRCNASVKALIDRIGGECVNSSASVLQYIVFSQSNLESRDRVIASMLAEHKHLWNQETLIQGITRALSVAINKYTFSASGSEVFIELCRTVQFDEENLVTVCSSWLKRLFSMTTENGMSELEMVEALLALQTAPVQKAVRTRCPYIAILAYTMLAKDTLSTLQKQHIRKLFLPNLGEQFSFTTKELTTFLAKRAKTSGPYELGHPLLAPIQESSELLELIINENNPAFLYYYLKRFGWPKKFFLSTTLSCPLHIAILRKKNFAIETLCSYANEVSCQAQALEKRTAWKERATHLAAKTGSETIIRQVFSLITEDTKHYINEQNQEQDATPVALYIDTCQEKSISPSALNVFWDLKADFTISTRKGHYPVFGILTCHNVDQLLSIDIFKNFLREKLPEIFGHGITDELLLYRAKTIATQYDLLYALASQNMEFGSSAALKISIIIKNVAGIPPMPATPENWFSIDDLLASCLFSTAQSNRSLRANTLNQTFGLSFMTEELFAPIHAKLEQVDNEIAKNPQSFPLESLLRFVQETTDKDSLTELYDKIRNRTPYLGTPPADQPEALEMFYQFLEKSLYRCVYFIEKSAQKDPSEENVLSLGLRVIDLADRTKMCATAAVWASFECASFFQDNETILSEKDQMAMQLYLLLTHKAMTALNDQNVHKIGQGYQLIAEKYHLIQFPNDPIVAPLLEEDKIHVYNTCSAIGIVIHLCENAESDSPIMNGYIKSMQESGEFDKYYDENGRIRPLQMLHFLQQSGILLCTKTFHQQEHGANMVIARHKLALTYEHQNDQLQALAKAACEAVHHDAFKCRIIQEMHPQHALLPYYTLNFLKEQKAAADGRVNKRTISDDDIEESDSKSLKTTHHSHG
jgi:hypothetical protein